MNDFAWSLGACRTQSFSWSKAIHTCSNFWLLNLIRITSEFASLIAIGRWVRVSLNRDSRTSPCIRAKSGGLNPAMAQAKVHTAAPESCLPMTELVAASKLVVHR